MKLEDVIDRGWTGGIEWITKPAPIFGAINGYVRLPAGHPWRDLDLQMEDHVDVHGGVTYGPTSDGWIGFDTLHSGDWWPGMYDTFRTQPGPLSGERVWTAEDVASEARNLASRASAALAAMTADLSTLTYDEFRAESDRRGAELTKTAGTPRFPAARAQVEEVLIEWDRRLNVGADRIRAALDEDQASLDRIQENTLAAICEEEKR